MRTGLRLSWLLAAIPLAALLQLACGPVNIYMTIDIDAGDAFSPWAFLADSSWLGAPGLDAGHPADAHPPPVDASDAHPPDAHAVDAAVDVRPDGPALVPGPGSDPDAGAPDGNPLGV